MADESGKIKIGIEIDPSDAVEGLEKLQKELDNTGDATQEMAKSQKKGLEQSTSAMDKATKEAIEALNNERIALKESAKLAEKTGKEKSKALNNPDDIIGLENLRDTTGEFDSAIKGAAGAVGLFSPAAERAMFVTGELAGGMEGASRLTMLFKGGMGALISPVGLVTVGLVGLGAAFFLMGDDANQARIKTEDLDAALNGLNDSQDRVNASRVQLRVERGELTDLEAQLENVEEQVKKDMGQAWEQASAPLQGFKDNIRKAHDELVLLERKLDLISSGSMPAQSGQVARMTDRHKILAENLKLANAAMRDQIQASTDAGRAYRGTKANIDEEIELRTQLLNLKIEEQKKRKREEAQRKRNQQLAAEAARLAEVEREAQAALQEEIVNRTRVADLLAEAQGAAAMIERQYQKDLAEAIKLQQELGLSAVDAGDLTEAALKKRTEALAALNAQESGGAGKRKEEIAELIALEVSETDAITSEHKKRQSELLGFLQLKAITEEQFAAKSIELENKKNDQLAILQAAKAIETIDKMQNVTNAVSALLENAMKLQSEKILQEEEAALEEANGDIAAQDKIRKEFDKRRAVELNKFFQLQKASQIASAIMSGASGVIGALAPPPVGLGPNPAGVGMAITVGAVAATQIGLIASQQPSFHQGGIVGGDGDRQITAQGGEVVLNRDAVAAMGGAASANRLNNGSGGGGAVVVEMTYRGRMFDRMVVDNIAKGGPLKKALNSATKKGRRGRIGGRL